VTLPIRAVRWAPSWRVIPTRYTEDRILGKVAESKKDLEILSDLEQMTSSRRRQADDEVSLVRPEDRVTGPGSQYIMAPFTYLNPEGSRFSDGTNGVYYTSRTLATAVEETKYHRAVFLSRTKEGPMRLEMRVLTVVLDGDLHDLRGQQKKHPELYHVSRYSASQGLAAELIDEGSNGIVYDSVRDKGGECAAIFRPPVLSRCQSAGLLAYDWNGTEIVKVYEMREYK
jgi:hypothetical protein